ncbi:MAG: hypothetical protein QM757_43325 [Paludibaculum sp.]
MAKIQRECTNVLEVRDLAIPEVVSRLCQRDPDAVARHNKFQVRADVVVEGIEAFGQFSVVVQRQACRMGIQAERA